MRGIELRLSECFTLNIKLSWSAMSLGYGLFRLPILSLQHLLVAHLYNSARSRTSPPAHLALLLLIPTCVRPRSLCVSHHQTSIPLSLNLQLNHPGAGAWVPVRPRPHGPGPAVPDGR